ncbi:hypothetical protein HZH68_014982 [Vespula germanica]|uniref:Transposase n=1 Tax=Vespula germanica TaxID=30212 RepID=A0A834MU67_VESGE|nr:hypothetical protein HZH68_014982 [Vespula germanica]
MNLVLNHHQMRKILDHKKLFGNQYPRQIIVVIALKKEIALKTSKNPTLFEIISDILDYTNSYALQCDLAKPISVSANGIEHAVFLCPFTCYQDLKLLSEIRDKSFSRNLEANTNNSEVMYSLQKVRPILNNLVKNFNCIPIAEHFCVDEQIIQFKGRHSHKTNFGFGSWEFILVYISALISKILSVADLVFKILHNNVISGIFHSEYFTKKNIYPILNQAYRKRFLNLTRKCRQTGNSKNLETLSTSKVIHNITIFFSYHHLDLRDKINLKKLQIFFFVKDLQDPPHCGEPLKASTIKLIFRPFPLFNWGFVKGMIYL